MGFKDLADVIRMQLMQLQTKNPMDDDFYYQVYSARKGEPWKGLGFPGENTNRMKENVYRNADGSSVMPEGTLGRIACSNTRRPRMMIQLEMIKNAGEGNQDLSSMNSEKETREMNMFFGHSLVFIIEEGMRCLMNIEDLEGLIYSSPDNQELPKQRESLSRQLMEFMGIFDQDVIAPYNPHHLMYKIAVLPKGRHLVLRSLSLLDQPLAVNVVSVILGNLLLFANPPEPSRMDFKASDAICDILLKCPVGQTASLFLSFLTEDNFRNIREILRSKTGCLVFDTFFKAGHFIRKDPHAPSMLVMGWLHVYSEILRNLDYKLGDLVHSSEMDESEETLHSNALLSWEMILHVILHANNMELSMITQDAAFKELLNQFQQKDPVLPPIVLIVNHLFPIQS